jgi:hypothetical protein
MFLLRILNLLISSPSGVGGDDAEENYMSGHILLVSISQALHVLSFSSFLSDNAECFRLFLL